MLSPNELEIMELLWSTGRSLTSPEIVKLSPHRSWTDRSLYFLLNSLMKKEAVIVTGSRPTWHSNGRTYAAAITREEYTARELEPALPKAPSRTAKLTGVFAAMTGSRQCDKETLDKLQKLLDEKRRELEEGN